MSKRAIKGLALGDLVPGEIVSDLPTVEWVSPDTLLVDEEYQRALSENSVRLIRRIIAHWDWRRFKPPIVARTDQGDEVLDGQHTAIAAASHPAIDSIPIVVVRADTVADRASAFVGQNRDRLGITPMQMHFSAVAAGDENAQTINLVCERAGLRILKGPPRNGIYEPGDTVAIAAIGKLIDRRYAKGAREVLQVLSDARCAPVSSDQVKAIEHLMYEEEYRDSVTPEDLTTTVMKMADQAIDEAKIFARAHRLPTWRALAVVLFRNTRKRRKAG